MTTTRKMTDPELKMWSLSEDTCDKVYDIIDKLPISEQQKLIRENFGSDFFDIYADWLAGE